MSKQLNYRKKDLEIILQNLTNSKIAKLSKVGKFSVRGILRRYKDTQTIERKRDCGRKKEKEKCFRSSGQLQEIHANPKEILAKSSNAVFTLSEKHSRARFKSLHQEKNSEAIN